MRGGVEDHLSVGPQSVSWMQSERLTTESNSLLEGEAGGNAP